MKKWFLCILIIIGFVHVGNAQQSRYIIKFKNKGSNPFSIANPSQYLSQRAIARRTRYSLPIDSTDLPVTPRYIDSLRLAGVVTILNVSKWLNQVSIQTTDVNALNKINSFPFVQTVAPIAARINPDAETPVKLKEANSNANQRTTSTTADFYDYGASSGQVRLHNGDFLHNIGLRGQTMVIGMLDAGYKSFNTLKGFDSASANGQFLGTWDFVARESSVSEDDAHGMYCLSIIATNLPGQLVGTAPKANFYLFRTEDVFSEFPIEEHNWVCGAERVDSSGGDVISSSLGYSDHMTDPAFNHTYSQMNGNTLMATIGADLAAKKGILVVNAAGNQGNESFKYISSPADGDSVLAVGAVNSNGFVGSFSSYGPSSDGRVKPDVASVGVSTFVQNLSGGVGAGNGTSFACPNIAGLATCLWQGFQEFNNIRILNALRQAGSIATVPDDRIGYGIPDMKKAVMTLVKEYSTATAGVLGCNAVINWKSKDVASMKYEIERKAPGESTFTKVAERFGTGNVFSNQSYSLTENISTVQSGTILYRIKQIIDTSANATVSDYIDTVTVSFSQPCVNSTNENAISIMPNPARNTVTLKITTLSEIENLVIKIMDAKGSTVMMVTKRKQAGTENFDLPVYHLSRGNYFVSVFNGERLIKTEKLIKL